MPGRISIVGEDLLHIAVLKRICICLDLEIASEKSYGGKSRVDKLVSGLLKSRPLGNWLVLRDLDRDAICAPSLLQKFPSESEKVSFRIVVREVEAWVLADFQAARDFFGFRTKSPIRDLEAVEYPKREFLKLCKHSRIKMSRDMVRVARESGDLSPGPLYNPLLEEFILRHWRLDVAAESATSLAKAVAAARRYSVGTDGDERAE